MKNNLVLKVVIGVLIVAVAGLVVRSVVNNLKVQTNVAETTTTVTVFPTTVTLTSTTTSTTKSTFVIPNNWKTYTNTQYGFEFKYPNEIAFSSPMPDTFNVFGIDSWTNPKSSKNGPAVGLVISLLDVSGEKRLEEEKSFFSLNKQNYGTNQFQEIKLGEKLGLIYRSINSATGREDDRDALVVLSTFNDKYFYSFQCDQKGMDLNLCDQIISTFKFIN